MSLVAVTVYAPDGTTLIADVPHARGQQWRNELNVAGTGNFEMNLDEPVLDGGGTPVPLDTLLAGRNVVRFVRTSDSVEVKAWRIEALAPVTVSQAEKAGRWVTVSGRGILADTELAVVYPEILTQATASDERAFNFSAPSFASILVPTDWTTPFGVAQSADPTARGTYPRPWHDATAQWLWSSSPTTSAAPGRNWFRTVVGAFVLAADAEIILEAAADNYAEVWLDGERIILTDPTDPFAWKSSYEFSKTLVAGEHVIAAAVDNWTLSDGGNNPGGFICDVFTTNAVGDRDTLVFHSDPTTFEVKAYGDPPGWTFGDILNALVSEAQARGATDLDAMSLGFGGDLDSHGVAWPDSQDRTLRIGDDVLRVVTQATEVACDVWTDGLTLKAAPRRGADLRSSVTFTAGVDVLRAAPTFKGGATRNVALIRYGARWLVVEDAASIALYGRREVFLQLGNAGSQEQATSTAEATFVETGLPEINVPLQSSSAVGPQPHANYDVGDVITGPGLFGDPAPLRVMAITGTAGESSITYDSDLYPEE